MERKWQLLFSKFRVRAWGLGRDIGSDVGKARLFVLSS